MSLEIDGSGPPPHQSAFGCPALSTADRLANGIERTAQGLIATFAVGNAVLIALLGAQVLSALVRLRCRHTMVIEEAAALAA